MSVGCGYVALGGLALCDPHHVKRLVRSRLGILRPLGLSIQELLKLAPMVGLTVRLAQGWAFQRGKRPTLADFARRAAPGRYVVCSERHWVSFFKGQDGSVCYFDSGGRSVRMRITWAVPVTRTTP